MNALLLADGVKGFFENDALVLGVPLLALGALGALLILSPIGILFPRQPGPPPPEPEYHPLPAAEGHVGPDVYIRVGLILSVVTAIEVAIYYVDLVEGLFIGVLLALSLAKFVLVVLWFMHLRFDSRIFSTLFTGGLALVMMLFAVVLATLGASLI